MCASFSEILKIVSEICWILISWWILWVCWIVFVMVNEIFIVGVENYGCLKWNWIIVFMLELNFWLDVNIWFVDIGNELICFEFDFQDVRSWIFKVERIVCFLFVLFVEQVLIFSKWWWNGSEWLCGEFREGGDKIKGRGIVCDKGNFEKVGLKAFIKIWFWRK
jgi:hypothetical protein